MRPAQPAPVREPQPEPVAAPVATPAPVANVVPVPANGGLFGWVKRIFVGAPTVPAATAPKVASEPQRNDRNARGQSRRDQRNGGKQGGRDQPPRRDREQAAQGQPQQKDRQGQQRNAQQAGKQSQQPSQPQQKKPQQPQKQDKPAQQQQKPQPKAAEPVEQVAQANPVAPAVEAAKPITAPVAEAVRTEATASSMPVQEVAVVDADAAIQPTPASEGDASAIDVGQDGNGRRRRGRRGGRRRRRGAGEAAALAADGVNDDLQDDEGEDDAGDGSTGEARPASTFAQRNQPEFDFDDAGDGNAATTPVATPEPAPARPQAASVETPVAADTFAAATDFPPAEEPAVVAAEDILADTAPAALPVERIAAASEQASVVIAEADELVPTAAVEAAIARTTDDAFALEAQAATFAAHIPVGGDELATPPPVEAAARSLQLDAAPGLFDRPELAKIDDAEEASPAAEAADTLASANSGEARDPDEHDDGAATRSA